MIRLLLNNDILRKKDEEYINSLKEFLNDYSSYSKWIGFDIEIHEQKTASRYDNNFHHKCMEITLTDEDATIFYLKFNELVWIQVGPTAHLTFSADNWEIQFYPTDSEFTTDVRQIYPYVINVKAERILNTRNNMEKLLHQICDGF